MDTTIVKLLEPAASSLIEKLLVEGIKIIPSLLWVIVALVIVKIFYKQIRDDLLPNLAGFRALGVEFSFVKKSITKAIELAEKSEKWHVIIPEEDRQRVLARVEEHMEIFEDAQILWIDDLPDNNQNERRMFDKLKARVEIATSTTAGLNLLKQNTFDLIISDIARGDDETAGLEFLKGYWKKPEAVPVIFYVGTLKPEKGIPIGAFGITHRPDELLHLVLDVLERSKYV
ncbi:MAG: response regulator [bacterium]